MKIVKLVESLAEDEKKLLYMCNVRPILNTRALFSDATEKFRNPCEPEPGDEVKLRLRTGRYNVDKAYVYINNVEHEMNKVDSNYKFDYYEAVIHVDENKIYYYFKVRSGNATCYYNQIGAQEELNPYYNFEIIPGFSTPQWAKGAVMYQIFVDRFYDGDKSNNVINDEYSYIGEHVNSVSDWNKYPATMGIREFYGGDLKGVWDKLDYLSDLGVDVIYLNPIFVSPSNHKYDIQDYDYVDPHFGVIVSDDGETLAQGDNNNVNATRYKDRVTNRANLEAGNKYFADLVQHIHSRGMKVIIDGVFNHCGSFNKWLDREHIYSSSKEHYEPGAYESYSSPYHDFFKFYSDQWPDNNSYDGWWGHDTLPKLNYEDSKTLEDYILGVAKKWVSAPYNVDGWRLDVAADLGHSEEYNHYFWKRFRQAVKEANPQAIILAENYGDSYNWLHGGEWDTIMNYDAFMEPVTWFLTGMQKHSDEFRQDMLGNADNFFGAMHHNMSRMGGQAYAISMNELSNHDHSRFLTRTNGRVGRTSSCGPEEANKGICRAVMKEAVVMQMTWPGAPTIYYGDEAGVCGWTDPDNRRTYPWGHEDMDLLEFHRDMIQMHKRNPALAKGSLIPLHAEYNLIAYARTCQENKLVIIINNNDEDREISIKVYPAGISYEAETARIVETAEEWYNVGRLPVDLENGELHVVMKRKSAAVYDCSGSEPVIFCETTH